MPKDVTKNIDRYKVRGGELNEYDFQQNQEQYVKEKALAGRELIPTKATDNTTATKGGTENKPTSLRGATAKKLAARKATNKAAKATKTARKATKTTRKATKTTRKATKKK